MEHFLASVDWAAAILSAAILVGVTVFRHYQDNPPDLKLPEGTSPP